ncbi:hypothetical protein [Wenjunlia tyrosinilytica]|jgi:hypothetical protein|uniref:Uncharacterized protein n=1 Tax=Wenjunlia tyrosinilytica TaxID=1544741 RepID=A0A917ZYH5_9ACTN|nr:hypothetical protein [Wenjunlia tyrosinilytica]GGP00609.1 hypothetical protein GCM10012280_69740 [Wenjunlia tyrosinilytica]
MDDNLITNPHVSFEAYAVVRRRGRPMERIMLRTSEELALMRAAAADRSSADVAGQREAAARLGLLLPPDEVPASKEELAFRCDIGEELLDLVPRMSRDACPVLDAQDLEPNPHLYVQDGPEPPVSIAARVAPAARVTMGAAGFAPEWPVVWAEYGPWGTLMPFWSGGTWGRDLRRVAVDRVPLSELPADALRALHLAGILRPRARQSAAHAPAEVVARDAGVLRGLFSPLFTAGMRAYYRRMRAEGYFRQDRQQVPEGHEGTYCDAVTLFVQKQLSGVVARWTGGPVKPSHAWAMTYLPGAVLDRHRDRPQSRWNVSFCLDADPDHGGTAHGIWPFWIEGRDRDHEVDLGIGDAVIHSGIDQDHWREALPEGRLVTMGLLHYVDADFSGVPA